jgi:hypothetical protein
VTFATSGTRGVAGDRARTRSASSPATGFIIEEWKA